MASYRLHPGSREFQLLWWDSDCPSRVASPYPKTKKAAVRATSSSLGNDSLLVLFPEFRDDAEIFQRGGVTLDFAAGCEFAQQTPHDLAGTGLGKHVGEADIVRTG